MTNETSPLSCSNYQAITSMKRMNIHTLLILLMFLFSACIDDVMTNNYTDNSEIKFSIGFADSLKMRVTTDDSFKTNFDKGDTIGVFIYKRDIEQESSIENNEIYVNNRKMIYDGESWNLESPVYYPGDGKVLDFYAYYPYRVGANADALIYDASLEMADLLAASILGVEKKIGHTVPLLFKHLLSLVHLTIDKTDDVPELDETFNAYFNGVVCVVYNLASNTISSVVCGMAKMLIEGDADANKRVYRAWVPAQQIAPSDTIFSFSQISLGKEFSLIKEAEQALALSQGKVIRTHIRLDIQEKRDFTYQVYDPYPKYGTPVGMVISVSNEGKSGVVISLKDLGFAQWSTQNVSTDAWDEWDGISNMMKIQAFDNWETDYPAFRLCALLGEGWYIPSIEGAYPYLRTNVDELNYYLLAIPGGEAINTGGTYLTSTETSATHVRKIYVWTGDSTPELKSNTNRVRAFFQF